MVLLLRKYAFTHLAENAVRVSVSDSLDVPLNNCDTVGNKEKNIYYDVQFKTSAVCSESDGYNEHLRMRQFYAHSTNIGTS
jgi:hypothetical protein